MRVLILGGTGDASELASQVTKIPDVKVITSLAGRTHNPLIPKGSVRIGGFGGESGLVEYIKEQKIDVLIDATHPFASQISFNAESAAVSCGIPHLMFIRPEWEKVPGDEWIEVENVESAAAILPNFAKRVFLTVGRQQLSPFANLHNMWFLMRLIDPPEINAVIPQGKILCSRGPFALEDEHRLLVEHRIDTLVSKNSGGDATKSKIIAARELGIKVVMVKRPLTPQGEKVSDVDSAVRWLLRVLHNLYFV
ncbi:MAG: cobalt-precorrin-6A reductase [Scytonematopsis contorta HA4267-MV1]|jgi:precorrin-6A/cobalt-precorrin-6A reductase|nr:cobalt-precorrin-6A reductase [Scytonematopsis contorta HA4267-MV1]